jgi:hypothetical protein
MRSLFVTCVFVLGLALVPLTAQNSIKLQFELSENGTLVARPTVTVTSGGGGSLTRDSIGRVGFTATMRTSETVTLEFDIASDSGPVRPRIVVGANSGSTSWTTPSGTAVELKVAWVRQ